MTDRKIIYMPFGLVRIPETGLFDFAGKLNDSVFQLNPSRPPFEPFSLLCLGLSIERVDFEGQQRGWRGCFRFLHAPPSEWVMMGYQIYEHVSFDDLAVMIKRPATQLKGAG